MDVSAIHAYDDEASNELEQAYGKVDYCCTLPDRGLVPCASPKSVCAAGDVFNASSHIGVFLELGD